MRPSFPAKEWPGGFSPIHLSSAGSEAGRHHERGNRLSVNGKPKGVIHHPLCADTQGKKGTALRDEGRRHAFFNGSSIHGPGPNRSKDRFRRSFICHYVPKSTLSISKFYIPLLTPEGEEVFIAENQSGGACGQD